MLTFYIFGGTEAKVLILLLNLSIYCFLDSLEKSFLLLFLWYLQTLTLNF